MPTISIAPDLSPTVAQRIVDSFARQGFSNLMGARLVELAPGRCVIEAPFSDGVSQQQGFFHGGAIGALADSAGGYAAMTTTGDNTEVVAIEYKINFLRPALGQTMQAEATVLRAGRSVVVTRVDVYAVQDGERKLCAAMQQSVAPVPA